MDDIPVIDTHIHAWASDDPRFPMYIPSEQYPWWRGTTEEYIGEMEAAGIDRAVIVQIPYHRYDHAYAPPTAGRRRLQDRRRILPAVGHRSDPVHDRAKALSVGRVAGRGHAGEGNLHRT